MRENEHDNNNDNDKLMQSTRPPHPPPPFPPQKAIDLEEQKRTNKRAETALHQAEARVTELEDDLARAQAGKEELGMSARDLTEAFKKATSKRDEYKKEVILLRDEVRTLGDDVGRVTKERGEIADKCRTQSEAIAKLTRELHSQRTMGASAEAEAKGLQILVSKLKDAAATTSAELRTLSKNLAEAKEANERLQRQSRKDEADLTSSQRSLVALKESLTKEMDASKGLHDKIRALEVSHNDAERVRSRLSTELKMKAEEIEELQSALRELESEKSALRSKVATEEKQLQSAKSDKERSAVENANLIKELDVSAERLDALTRMVSSKDAEISALSSDLTERDGEIDKLRDSGRS